jgi:hypothetical protein
MPAKPAHTTHVSHGCFPQSERRWPPTLHAATHHTTHGTHSAGHSAHAHRVHGHHGPHGTHAHAATASTHATRTAAHVAAAHHAATAAVVEASEAATAATKAVIAHAVAHVVVEGIHVVSLVALRLESSTAHAAATIVAAATAVAATTAHATTAITAVAAVVARVAIVEARSRRCSILTIPASSRRVLRQRLERIRGRLRIDCRHLLLARGGVANLGRDLVDSMLGRCGSLLRIELHIGLSVGGLQSANCGRSNFWSVDNLPLALPIDLVLAKGDILELALAIGLPGPASNLVVGDPPVEL